MAATAASASWEKLIRKKSSKPGPNSLPGVTTTASLSASSAMKSAAAILSSGSRTNR
jgi:hypothetical protein